MFKKSIELFLNLKNESQELNAKEIKTASSTDNIQDSYGQYAKLPFISLVSRSLSTGVEFHELIQIARLVKHSKV